MSTQYTLRVVRMEDLPKMRGFSWPPSHLYAKVKLGDDSRKTRSIEKNKDPVWEERLIFYSSDQSAILNIQVKRKLFFRSDCCIGHADISLADLMKECANGEASLIMSTPTGKALPRAVGSMILQLESGDLFANAETALDEADQVVQQRGIVHSVGAPSTVNIINDQSAEASNGSELYRATKEILSRLEVFKNVIDAVSEIHPFLSIAWNVTSGLLQVVVHVFETDAKVVGLVHAMREAFAFIDDLKALSEKVRTLQEPIIGLLKQTIECCVFIRLYTNHGFGERILDSSSSRKVDEFERSLVDFKRNIEFGATIHTSVVSLRISKGIDTLLLRHLLIPSLSDAFDRPVCLAGTRVEVQRQILGWIFSETKQNVLWLHGVAGSGKSTIGTTIARHLRDMSRLGAYIFFERGKSEPSSVIRTIAYKLALFDSSIASNILSSIERDKDVTATTSIEQFSRLLAQPLADARSVPGPIVIVLDALDECGTPESRRSLMQLLTRDFSKLPNNFRFLITSRREPDIDKALSSRPGAVRDMELDFTSAASKGDVLLYIRDEMYRAVREQVEVGKDWPWDESMALLGKTSGGLFIWASTAVKLVSTSDNPFVTLEELITDSRLTTDFGLYQLYDSVLRNSGIVWAKDASRSRFQKVIGLLLLSKESLSTQAIDRILGFPPQETSLLILSKLRCLLAYSPDGPVSLFHASFSDYLLSSKRMGHPWFVDVPAQHNFVATRCFSIMKEMLHFNMCNLGTSFVRNNDIPDLQTRVRKCIPPHLNYACAHWSHHLCEVPYSTDLLDKLSEFVLQRLLFWFEVLSLGSQFRLASPALLDASRWTENHNVNVSSFLTDASRLASDFSFPIAQSSPHIYTSLVPLTKGDSEVSAHYSNRMASLVRVERRGIKRPPRWLRVLEGHRDWVWSVVVSPDGKRVASASRDKTIRVWEIDSGEEITEPMTGHLGDVISISFSPNGTRLVSGSADNTVRIWDAQDYSLILGPLEQHTDFVRSVTYSAVGDKIASGSSDKTIVIWNALNGQVIAGPLEGHTDSVRSVTFSPDGSRLASGSWDKTIRIWSVKSGEPVLRPFTGHTNKVESVAFSPDGEHVVSGSRDMTIRIWEVKSGSIVYGPFHGHTNTVMSVAYSPCGSRVISGSADNTICLWNAKNGSTISDQLVGHAVTISSVTFSRDGALIISGSHDTTVRIWPATSMEADTGPFSGHKGAVTCVRFSTDGRRVASASVDGSIVIWNTHSGEVVAVLLEDNRKGIESIAFSSDSSRLISGSNDCKVRIWDVESGKVIRTLDGHADQVWCVALSPNDMQIVSGSKDGTIRVWNMEDGRLVAGPLNAHSRGIRSVVFSPDASRLASCSNDRTIRIWSTENWEANPEPLKRHEGEIESVCFSPDSKRIASGSSDRTVILSDVENGEVLGGPFRLHTDWVRSVIFLPDGKHLLSGSWDRTIRVWNIDTGRTMCEPLEGHSSAVKSLALSSDGVRLASGSNDNTVRIWDLSGILGDTNHEDGAESVSVHNNGSAEWALGENGWIFGGRDRRELLLWVPPDLRRTLWSPRNTAVFSCEFSTRLDFTGAALGERWTECFMTQ